MVFVSIAFILWGGCEPPVSPGAEPGSDGIHLDGHISDKGGERLRDMVALTDASELALEGVSDHQVTHESKPSTASGLPQLHTADPAKASSGKAWLSTKVLAGGLVPRTAMEYLWVVWGTGPSSGAAYWDTFRKRYGFFEAPFENGGLPMGIRDAGGGMVGFDCLMCHAGRVAGEVIVGAPNTTLDLQGLFDDLTTLADVATQFGFPKYPVPWKMKGRTGASGATDAFGLGMELSKQYGPSGSSIHTTYGFQRSNGWWTLKFKKRMYADGSGQVGGYRSMMAMLLAFGGSWSELQSMEPRMEAVGHYILSIPRPTWSLTPIDEAKKKRGRALFGEHCARCHGVYEGDQRLYPDMIIPVAEVGTDPLRATQFTKREETWINASWFGQKHPMRSTQGYVAPPLSGIWARAPYFHNGSIPDLMGVLDPSDRPKRWTRTGSGKADYDPERVGWRYTTIDKASDRSTIAGRKVYDTTLPGLSNAGHLYGAALKSAEKLDLLEYLKSL